MNISKSEIPAEKRNRILQNLFPYAHGAVEPFDKFAWHKNSSDIIDTDLPHSSQALAIDVFGTIRESPIRAVLFSAVMRELGIESANAWEAYLEWADPQNRLCETWNRRLDGRTRLDLMSETSHVVASFECKFTESGGTCSQTMPRRRQCDGNYASQVNPFNQVEARCALSGKGIRYWELIPAVFALNAMEDHRPCPFAGDDYQLMRTLVLTYELARLASRQAVVVLVYADGPFSTAELVQSSRWRAFVGSVRPEAVTLHAISYQKVVDLCFEACEHHPEQQKTWMQLRHWLAEKIRARAQRDTP